MNGENLFNSDHKAMKSIGRKNFETIFNRPGNLDRCITCDDNPKYGGNCQKSCVPSED